MSSEVLHNDPFDAISFGGMRTTSIDLLVQMANVISSDVLGLAGFVGKFLHILKHTNAYGQYAKAYAIHTMAYEYIPSCLPRTSCP